MKVRDMRRETSDRRPEKEIGGANQQPGGLSSPTYGLECPKCGCHHFLVWYTRPLVGQIKRVRVCRHCGRRLVTLERSAHPASDLSAAVPAKADAPEKQVPPVEQR